MNNFNKLADVKEKFKNSKIVKCIKNDNSFRCPKCNNVMIKRDSKFDDKKYWYGCSAFPLCKYTINDNKTKININ